MRYVIKSLIACALFFVSLNCFAYLHCGTVNGVASAQVYAHAKNTSALDPSHMAIGDKFIPCATVAHYADCNRCVKESIGHGHNCHVCVDSTGGQCNFGGNFADGYDGYSWSTTYC